MSFNTLTKIRLSAILACTVILTGCNFQKQDYLSMVTPAELNRIMQHEDIFMVDVHTPKQAHIKGTDLFLPYNEIEKNQHKLPKDKNTAIYLYCESGPMADTAAKSLHGLGYRNLISLEGGAKAWRSSELAFE